MKTGDRVRIKKLQPWAEEYGTYVGDETTLIGVLHKIYLDNGHSVLQKRDNLIILEGDFKYPSRGKR